MTDRPFLIVHNVTDTLIIKAAPNGGYVVTAHEEDRMGIMPILLGAFSNRFDLLTTLAGGEFEVSRLPRMPNEDLIEFS